jgi:hypothetical protein
MYFSDYDESISKGSGTNLIPIGKELFYVLVGVTGVSLLFNIIAILLLFKTRGKKFSIASSG